MSEMSLLMRKGRVYDCVPSVDEYVAQHNFREMTMTQFSSAHCAVPIDDHTISYNTCAKSLCVAPYTYCLDSGNHSTLKICTIEDNGMSWILGDVVRMSTIIAPIVVGVWVILIVIRGRKYA